jgi:hypothetical protein
MVLLFKLSVDAVPADFAGAGDIDGPALEQLILLLLPLTDEAASLHARKNRSSIPLAPGRAAAAGSMPHCWDFQLLTLEELEQLPLRLLLALGQGVSKVAISSLTSVSGSSSLSFNPARGEDDAVPLVDGRAIIELFWLMLHAAGGLSVFSASFQST